MASWTMIGALIVWTIVFEFLLIFRCGTHFDSSWGTFQGYIEYCNTSNARQVAFSVTDVFADLALLVVPIPIVSKPRIL